MKMSTILDLCEPSPRLLEHYKKKTAEWQERVAGLIAEVEDCKAVCSQYADTEVQLQKKEMEVKTLSLELDKVRRELFDERVQVLKLVEGKDRLKLELLDCRRTFKIVLDVLGLKECEISSFLQTPLTKDVKDSIKSSRIKRGVKKIIDLGIDPEMKISKLNEDLHASNLKIKLLQSQLEEQHCLFKEEVENLLEERKKLIEEEEDDRKRLQHKISCLNCRLESTRKQICHRISTKLVKEFQDTETSIKLMLENEKLMKCLIICKEMLGDDFPHLDESKPKKLKDEIKHLQTQLSEKIMEVQNLKTQINYLRLQVNKIDEEREQSVENYKKEKIKLIEKFDMLNRKYENEHKRRINDSIGFRNDIKLLRSNLHCVERLIRIKEIRKKDDVVKSDEAGEGDKKDADKNSVAKEKGILKKSKSR